MLLQRGCVWQNVSCKDEQFIVQVRFKITQGVQNPDRGGANAPPSFFAKALSRAASEVNLLNDRQGGARGFIVKRV
jgi:hypothetical protein